MSNCFGTEAGFESVDLESLRLLGVHQIAVVGSQPADPVRGESEVCMVGQEVDYVSSSNRPEISQIPGLCRSCGESVEWCAVAVVDAQGC